MARVLLADDDEELLIMLSSWLKLRDHIDVDTVSDGLGALEYLQSYTYDAVILDWEMPGKSGPEVCREFRVTNKVTPVLMLTGKDSLQDKLSGFDAGLDDYLTKPFSASELSARLRAMFRRPAEQTVKQLCSGDLVLELDSFVLRNLSGKVQLTALESALIEFFMRNAAVVFAPEVLIARAWRDSDEATVAGVRAAIMRLRKKLEAGLGVCPLETVRGAGYQWTLK